MHKTLTPIPARVSRDAATYFTRGEAFVDISAIMCLDCGFIELWGDAATARQLLKRDR